jgi:hypothetical protein
MVHGLGQHGLLNDLFHVLKRNTRSLIHFFNTGQLMIFDNR